MLTSNLPSENKSEALLSVGNPRVRVRSKGELGLAVVFPGSLLATGLAPPEVWGVCLPSIHLRGWGYTTSTPRNLSYSQSEVPGAASSTSARPPQPVSSGDRANLTSEARNGSPQSPSGGLSYSCTCRAICPGSTTYASLPKTLDATFVETHVVHKFAHAQQEPLK